MRWGFYSSSLPCWLSLSSDRPATFSCRSQRIMEKQANDYYAAASEAAKDSKLEKTASATFSSHEVDELELAGFVAPTEEEMDTLRHVSDKINWSAYRTCSFTFVRTLSLTWLQSSRSSSLQNASQYVSLQWRLFHVSDFAIVTHSIMVGSPPRRSLFCVSSF
jgi:hypothetical protein